MVQLSNEQRICFLFYIINTGKGESATAVIFLFEKGFLIGILLTKQQIRPLCKGLNECISVGSCTRVCGNFESGVILRPCLHDPCQADGMFSSHLAGKKRRVFIWTETLPRWSRRIAREIWAGVLNLWIFKTNRNIHNYACSEDMLIAHHPS